MNAPTESRHTRRSTIPWQAKLSIAIICGAIFVGAVFYGMIRSYLHSDAFRRLLSEKASQAIGTTGEFGAFRWDGFALESASFSASGEGSLRSLQMEGLHTEVGLGGLKNGVWEINGSKIQRLSTSFDFNQIAIEPTTDATASTSNPPTQFPETSSSRTWLPREVKFDGLQIADATINAKFGDTQLAVSNLRVDLKSFGRNGHAAEMSGGTIEMADKKFPAAHIDRINLKRQDDRIFLNQLQLSAWDNARVEASGEVDRSSGRHSIEGSVSGVKCSDVLSGDWLKRLSGDLETTFSCHNHSGPTVASGKLVLKNGTLTAFPALDALATFTNIRRFRSLAFNDAHSDWQWQDGRLILDNLVIASDGAIRAEGNITIDGENLDGQLKIGLPTEVITKLPSAASNVFNINERGMSWASVRITGTTKNPKEDLSGRLMGAAVGAAAAQLIGQLQQGIPEAEENAAAAAEEIINAEKPLEKGLEVILENSDGARNLLKGLLEKLPVEK
ncbi:MAG: hypothetical protein RLY69_187 [Verrucomicrobiota bacterium]